MCAMRACVLRIDELAIVHGIWNIQNNNPPVCEVHVGPPDRHKPLTCTRPNASQPHHSLARAQVLGLLLVTLSIRRCLFGLGYKSTHPSLIFPTTSSTPPLPPKHTFLLHLPNRNIPFRHRQRACSSSTLYLNVSLHLASLALHSFRRQTVNMEPDTRKPMALAGVVILIIVVVAVKGSPLVRFQLITALFARWRNKRNAQAGVSNNSSRSAYASIRCNRIFVAIFGRPVSIPTADVEQGGTAPFDPSVSTPSLRQPPPAYTRHHTDVLFIGPVARNRPLVNTAPERGPVIEPPAYTPSLPSSSAGGSPAAVTAH